MLIKASISARASGRKTSHPTAIASAERDKIQEEVEGVQVHTNEPGTFHGFDTQLVMARIIRISEYVEQQGHNRPIML